MTKCDGTEKHGHYVLSTGEMFEHKHQHTVNEKDFNRLHHHAPLEHDNFTNEELHVDVSYTKTPF